MPNIIADIALISWPLVSVVLFLSMRVIPATFGTILGGYLLLPVNHSIDFPLIPALDKETISALAALVGCKFIKNYKIYLIPKSGLERWLLLIVIFSPFFTVLNNNEPIFWGYGEPVKPGLTLHDSFSLVVGQYLRLVPIILGIQIIKTYEDQLSIFKLLVIVGLAYSLPILFELRMSPQLHTWLYGYFPAEWIQQIRGSGFRANVFTGHGLFVAMFLVIVFGAALVLWKEKIKVYGVSAFVVAIYFLIILFLNKSLTAIVLGSLLLILIVWMPASILKKAIVVLSVIGISYPFLSIFELVPHDFLLELAAVFSDDRSSSLAERFYHQSRLLDHAQQKFFFGWGTWGRNMPPKSVIEGLWIITIGIYGFIGFLALYSLFFLSIFRAVKASKENISEFNKNMLLIHALIVSIILIENIPNTSYTGYLGFIIGALLGRANSLLSFKGASKIQESNNVYER